MKSLKDQIIDEIFENEGNGAFTDDPNDSGGATRWGVTEREARAYGYAGDMPALPRETAYAIISAKYWDAVGGDSLAAVSEAVTKEVVDTGVLMGPPTAAKFLQRMLNVMNRRGKSYPDIAVDGKVGGNTVAALKSYLARRDEGVLVRGLNVLQGAALVELAERREKDEEFIYGWLKNRVVV